MTNDYRSCKSVPHCFERNFMLNYRPDPLYIKIEETAQLYQLTRGSRRAEVRFDQDMEVKHCLHPTIRIPIDGETVHGTMQVFTDGSKMDQGVGAGIAVYRSGTHTKSLKYRLNYKCTNNQGK